MRALPIKGFIDQIDGFNCDGISAGLKPNGNKDLGFIEITLPKALIVSWIDNPAENHGLLIKASDNSDIGLIKITSKESTQTTKRPQLVLGMSINLCNGSASDLADTDGDGLYDLIEIGGDGNYDEGLDTDPYNADTDGDGLSDGVEDANQNGVAYITFDSNIGGAAVLRLDLNGDGDYNDEIDRDVYKFAQAEGDTILWDGLDGLGNDFMLFDGLLQGD